MKTDLTQAEMFEMPKWGIGIAEGCMDVGAQLCTKDGRIIGNAVVIELENTSAWIMTDMGTELKLTEPELEEFFHIPKWGMNVYEAIAKRTQRT